MAIRPVLKPKVVKDPKWLQVVRTMPCWFHGSFQCSRFDTMGNGQSEASHLDGKSRDDRVLPMDGGCHRTGHFAWHRGQRTFLKHHRTTKATLIRQAEALYASFKEGK